MKKRQETAKQRLADFASSVAYAPESVLTHAGHGWRYIAVNPFADDVQLLRSLHWPAERCRKVDAYWECGGDVYFVQVEALDPGGRAQGLYYRRFDAGGVNLVAIVEPLPVVRKTFEAVLSQFAPTLRALGSSLDLSPL